MNSEPSGSPVQTVPAPKKPVRRVGTLTMGIALVLTGLVIVLSMFFPALDLSVVFKLCPLLLVLLGCEIIWYTLRGAEQVRYDFLSMIVCFFVICASFAVSLIPQYLRYYGPERSAAEFRLTSQLNDLCAQQLGTDARVVSCRSSICLNAAGYDPNVKLDELNHFAYVDISLSLTGPYDDTKVFAADALELCQKLRQIDIAYSGFYISWQPADDSRSMQLYLDGTFTGNRTAEQLAQEVEVSGDEVTAYEFSPVSPYGTSIDPA